MYKTILTFRASSIGDGLMGKYLLENIRAAHPDARCALAVSGRAGLLRDLFAAYPWLTVVEVNKNPFSLLRFFARGRHDLVVTPYTGGVFGLLPKLAARVSARTLIGYSDASSLNNFFYTHLISLVGRSRAPRLLECDALASALPQGVALVLSGSRKQQETIARMDLPTGALVVDTTLQEFAALIDASAGMVSLDTGPAHLAAHLHKPHVIIGSCMYTQWWSKEQYGEYGPKALFSCADPGTHSFSGCAERMNAIDLRAVAAKAAQFFKAA